MSMPTAATPTDSAPATDPAWIDTLARDRARKASEARHASGRRRLIDPTTCDRDYSPEEMEFMRAMQEYKQRSGRLFPTWSEVLEVLHDLGYRRPDPTAMPEVP